jgi:hypothetical protein
VPDPGELIGDLVRLVGEVLGASSLRLGAGPTLAVLGVLLVLLQLVARPTSRWQSRDAGGLGGIGRAMALAAEAGTAVSVSLGTAGIARTTSAIGRLQTLAAIPILGHVARAASRAGVPVRVATNDPLAATLADATLDAAHRRTATSERRARSQAVFDGEGRSVAAGQALVRHDRPAAAFAAGGMGEEATLLLSGLASGAGSVSFGTADAAQAPAILLTAGGTMIGPQTLEASADLRADAVERTSVLAADRLLLIAIAVIVLGTALLLGGLVDVRGFLSGAA